MKTKIKDYKTRINVNGQLELSKKGADGKMYSVAGMKECCRYVRADGKTITKVETKGQLEKRLASQLYRLADGKHK